jgi:hypothetical protein
MSILGHGNAWVTGNKAQELAWSPLAVQYALMSYIVPFDKATAAQQARQLWVVTPPPLPSCRGTSNRVPDARRELSGGSDLKGRLVQVTYVIQLQHASHFTPSRCSWAVHPSHGMQQHSSIEE